MAFLDLHSEALAVLNDVVVQDPVIAEVVRVDGILVGVRVEELVVVLVVLQPVDAFLRDAACLDTLDKREDLEAIALEQDVAGLLVIDLFDEARLFLDEIVDVWVVDRHEPVPVLEDGLLVDGLFDLLVLVLLGTGVLTDLL